MHTSELVQLYVSAEKSFNPTNIIEANPTRATHNPTKIQVENTNYLILFLAPICFMIVWISVIFIISFSCDVARKKYDKLTKNSFQKVPCGSCRYFNNNQYLKCAVHPSTALTKEAINCSDYYPN